MPDGVQTFAEAMQVAVEVYAQLKGICKDISPEAVNVGELGGFTPQVDPEAAIEMLLKAIEKAGHSDSCKVAVDMAASQWSVKKESEMDDEDQVEKNENGEVVGGGSTAEAAAAAAENAEEDEDEEDGDEIMEYNLGKAIQQII